MPEGGAKKNKGREGRVKKGGVRDQIGEKGGRGERATPLRSPQAPLGPPRRV